ncbi:SelT/SelW/SelH family protein [Salinibius halmophilus]|uniref:SelT/SelW/SelH family protein n=1 Tax=Salinibius halmophilus TaxID=1853216 RepID=UPI000E661949|nr:SelT/SelW/SelH family protein [Salinibius halmophilus]
MVKVEIIYCAGCKWMVRAAWYAQELLQSFEQNGIAVTLIPELEQGGRFSIFVDGEMLADRKRDAGFPEIKALKRKLRNQCWPEKDLSHTDRCVDDACGLPEGDQ